MWKAGLDEGKLRNGGGMMSPHSSKQHCILQVQSGGGWSLRVMVLKIYMLSAAGVHGRGERSGGIRKMTLIRAFFFEG